MLVQLHLIFSFFVEFTKNCICRQKLGYKVFGIPQPCGVDST